MHRCRFCNIFDGACTAALRGISEFLACAHTLLSCRRGRKYQTKGWQVCIPGFDEVKLKRSIVDGSYNLLPKSEILLNAAPPELVGKEISIIASEVVGQHLKPREVKVKCSYLQRCRVVQGIEYLLAYNYARVKTAVCTDNLMAVPLLHQRNCLLLWSQKNDGNDIDISAAEDSAVDQLLEKNFKHAQTADDAWLSSGGYRKSTVTELRESVVVRMETNTHLDFVYWPRQTVLS